jgi:hypothetical protein
MMQSATQLATAHCSRAQRGFRRRPCRVLRRKGYALVWFALLLTLLVGMVGLVIDSGWLVSTYRQARNAADAAALAAAMELFRGKDDDAARAAAEQFIQTCLAGATLEEFNHPPLRGYYTVEQIDEDEAAKYVEVILTYEVPNFFIHVLPGMAQTSTVRARAVAGFEARAQGEGAIVLDPTRRPGLSVSGGGTLRVDGAVLVNSRHPGYDQYHTWLGGNPGHAAKASNNSTVYARYIQVAGGVDWVDNFHNIDPSGPHPLFAGAPIQRDPLRDLPVPDGSNGADLTPRGAVEVNNNSVKPFYLSPGIYDDILITQGAEAIFNPGIYILRPNKPNKGLRINGSATVTGSGVMFYVTGSNYLNNGAGYYDALDDALNDQLDGPLPPTPGSLGSSPDPGKVDFAAIDINATSARVTLTGINDTSSQFHDILFFQRRRNMNAARIQGNAGKNVTLGGAIYAKWANFTLSGGGRYDATFVVGSMDISGQGTVTINGTGRNFGVANQVFLVE